MEADDTSIDQAALRELESAIEDLEERLERVESDLVAASTAGDGSRIAALGGEHRGLKRALAEKYDARHATLKGEGSNRKEASG